MAIKDILEVEPYFTYNGVTVVNGDFGKDNLIKDGTVDLIVTSPPYNVGIRYDEYDDGKGYKDSYLPFITQCLKKCLAVLKEDGRLCLNISMTIKRDGDVEQGEQLSVYSDILQIAKELGFKHHTTIMWLEETQAKKSAWGSWASASAPYVTNPLEVIVVLYKGVWKKLNKGENDIKEYDFARWVHGVWRFNGEMPERVGHPAPFPVELPYRCIKLFSYVGDVVLDPFLGSGTTLIAAQQNKRLGVGIELSKDYCELAVKRIKEETGLYQKGLTNYLQNYKEE